VFDLAEQDWAGRMSAEQLQQFSKRLSGKLNEDQKKNLNESLGSELARRAHTSTRARGKN
jgi:hypothetical protein